MDLGAVRSELPVLARLAYLNAGTFGPLPRRCADAMRDEEARELEGGRSGAAYWERTSVLRQRVREGFAALVGAAADEIALMRSTTEGCAIAVGSLGLGPGDEIVTTDAEHFGLLGPLAASGATIEVARVADRPAAAALDAIEAKIGRRTRLVALSHVSWVTGHLLPVAALCGRGIPVLVDGAQAAGSIQVDAPAIGCDFYTISGQKWPLGPDGTGALYVSPRILDSLRVPLPSHFGTISRETDGRFVPAEGARRFEPGTIPGPALAGLCESLAFASGLGRVRFERALAMASRCRELLSQRVDVVTEPAHATLVSFRPRGDAAATVERLAERGVLVRDLPGLGWVRASVGFWTSEEDIDRLASGV